MLFKDEIEKIHPYYILVFVFLFLIMIGGGAYLFLTAPLFLYQAISLILLGVLGILITSFILYKKIRLGLYQTKQNSIVLKNISVKTLLFFLLALPGAMLAMEAATRDYYSFYLFILPVIVLGLPKLSNKFILIVSIILLILGFMVTAYESSLTSLSNIVPAQSDGPTLDAQRDARRL